jgi:hypothetical protein
MKLGKRILDNRAAQSVLGWLVVKYLRLVIATTKWDVLNENVKDKIISDSAPAIAVAWHGRVGMLYGSFEFPETVFVLVSQNRDGDLSARIMTAFGFNTIRGSAAAVGKKKKKNTMGATRAMMKVLKGGGRLFVTPDGPRGPRMRAGDGVIGLARLTGVPIYPITYSVRRRIVAKSWDRFVFPLPFNRGVFIWGTPISVARDIDAETQERVRLEIECQLNDMTREADERVGQPVIEPAPLPTASSTL